MKPSSASRARSGGRAAGGRGRLLPALVLVAAAWPAPDAGAHLSQAGGSGLFDVRSAEVPVDRSVTVATTGTLARLRADSETPRLYIADGGLTASVGVGGRTELYLRAGAAAWHSGSTDIFSYRDGLVGAKLALPGRKRWLATGLDFGLNLPVGSRPRGFSTDSWDPSVTALFTVPLPESNTLTSSFVHLNVGYRHFGDTRGRGYEGLPWHYLEPVYPAGDKDRLDLRGGLELASRKITIFVELLLDRILNDEVAWRESPLFITPGLRMNVGDSWSLLAASKITMATDDGDATETLRTPEELFPTWQIAFAIEWARQGPEVDRDDDGVPDWRDQCPRIPEDRDDWEDEDGCPDLDNDGDGVPDEFDLAPDAAEDFDGYLDSDGMPDPDNDGDGILDAVDECPDRAEDFDGVADSDGCPEEDADDDGIRDEDDKCPEEAETIDGIDDEDGCPDQVGLADPYLMPGVLWKGAEVAPEPVSYFELNTLAEKLRADPKLSIELAVHGLEGVGQRDLARRRAEYLKGFLGAAGISPLRVKVTSDEGSRIAGTVYGFAEIGRVRSLTEVIPLPRGEVAEQSPR